MSDAPENDSLPSLERIIAQLETEPQRLVAVVGPTASGKTEFAIRLAERLKGEVVNVDSVQVYRHFDVGSGKPSPAERARVPHHLLDCVDPLEFVDAAQFAERAHATLKDIRNRGRRPILCGGTFLWTKAVLFGLAEAPPAQPELRAKYKDIADREGRAALHQRLASLDPPTAERLHPNDFVRVSRALEVIETTGRSLSEWHREHGFRSSGPHPFLVGVHRTPEELTRRIARRVDQFLAQGWVDEVRDLCARGYEASRAMGSVGYTEVLASLRGTLPPEDLREKVIQSTRTFARRQRTFLASSVPPLVWVAPPELESL